MNKQTLERQFRLWTVLVVVVPGLIIMMIYTVGQISVAKRQNLELIQQQVHFQERLINYWIEERAGNIRELSQIEAFRNLDEQKMKSTLYLKQQSDTNFDSLSYIHKDGLFKMSTLPAGIQFPSAIGKPYFEEALVGKEYISDVVIGRNSGLPIINFSCPIYDYAGNFQGLILGSVKTATLEMLLRENWIGQTGDIFLVNREGIFLAEPRFLNLLIDKGIVKETAIMKLKLSDDALQNIKLGQSGTATWTSYLGDKILGAYHYMPERGWTLIGKINKDEVLTPIYKQLVMMACGTIFLVLLILPLATLITSRIKRPIDWLIRQSNRVATENYQMVGRDMPLDNIPYELRTLCETFVKMSYKIKNTVGLLRENEVTLENKMLQIQAMNTYLEEEVLEREATQQALVDLNAKLESKVTERTLDLQNMNAALEEEIMERQMAQEALSQKTEVIRQLAYSDKLTGLSNRTHLNERLEEEMEKTRRDQSAGALFFIDLDDLKMINDTFGHTYGDALIKMAGNRIVEAFGDGVFIGRIGGDEFMVIMSGDYDQRSIADRADQIIGAFSQDMEALGIGFHTSASVGIAVYPQDGDTVEEIFKNADNAMYSAKKAGKNCWRFYQPTMQAEAYEKILLINSLRHAIENNELLLHYQPQVSTNGIIIGFEALLRWNSPEHDSVSPTRFIPLAEQSGLIQSIGDWVLKEACQFARRLADMGWGHLHVAVNVSPCQLCANKFIDRVGEVLSDSGIEPQQLELEITENALISSLEESTHILKKLRMLGVRLSLDDFGTGYSSLTYLQRLPVSTLKIDKAFIDMILTDGAQKAIIATIIDMAHIMDMTVVAEGVETETQIDYLAQCGCDSLQGFIISKPVPEEKALLFLRNQKV
ncbi:EAL domain-containing protein [Pelosinus sp. UFO1]|uniref:bifunctional diguanylate cyclase/phosphodiesterase n=1 Tax=Pelosinus sp. UFO1 TaxID=484770 RepID=UPI0004D12774|nr:EAL domain-containing protein [Pelosinus sp. UFO1]AIF49746.1 diguanylate cyclase/phosphodiesterase [Pelosinus sp. UFO1]